MAAGRLSRGPTRLAEEWMARLFVIFLLLALALGILATGKAQEGDVTVVASMPESGGWQPGDLSARVDQPLELRLTSTDVVHGFAVGHTDMPAVDVEPGKVTELTLTFDEPGAYTFYCTRWCGPNHWRMRGTIVVSGEGSRSTLATGESPLYVQLGVDIDAPHPAAVTPAITPWAERGAELDAAYPRALSGREAYMTQSPVEVWLALRDQPELSHVGDGALWNAVAYLWRQNTSPETLALGDVLYTENCAACHGEGGAGDGVFASVAEATTGAERGHTVEPPTDFTDPALLGASNVLLQGKILRGGMGTGMPAWGAVLTDKEIQALLDYLWTFQFPEEAR